MRRSLAVGALVVVASLGCKRDRSDPGAASADTACPPEWLQVPAVDPSIAVPGGSRTAAVHAAATGTQNYRCARAAAADGGPATFTWAPVGPEATLADCRGTARGAHFASDAGAAAPEWQLQGAGSVVAHKVAAQPAPAGSGAVAWLLLGADRHEGEGPLATSRFIQRVGTRGGAAPSAGCDEAHVGEVQKVPYSADYYFFGP